MSHRSAADHTFLLLGGLAPPDQHPARRSSHEGGPDNDICTVGDAGDVVVEDADKAGGNDLVKSSIRYTLGIDIEKLSRLGNAHLTGTGAEINSTPGRLQRRQILSRPGRHRCAGRQELNGGKRRRIQNGC